MNYQPNLVARQFGISQMLPKSLVSHSSDIVWAGRQLNADNHVACLKFHEKTQQLELPVFKFQHSFFTTKDFDKWWNAYQCQYFSSSMFLQILVYAFFVLAGEPSTDKPTPTAHIEDARIVDDAETPPKKVTLVS